jgi:hypothetical protein
MQPTVRLRGKAEADAAPAVATPADDAADD